MTSDPNQSDFASAAMIRLIIAGLKAQGLAAPSVETTGPRVPRRSKKSVLDTVLDRYGGGAVLRIADAGRDLPPDPVSLALTRARDLPDLWDRWHRLERFSHGRHRVAVQAEDGNRFRMVHTALKGAAEPSFVETALVISVLTMLAERVSGAGLTLTAPNGDVWRSNGVWAEPPTLDVAGTFLLDASWVTTLPAMPVKPETKDLPNRIRTLFFADPVKRWTVQDAATELGTSARTLQRRLGAEGATFSDLIRDVRLQVAADLLCRPDGPGLAVIGFLSGFADQAHFTRSFSNTAGTTPSAYRNDFKR